MMEKHGVVECPNCKNIDHIEELSKIKFKCKNCGLTFKVDDGLPGMADHLSDSK